MLKLALTTKWIVALFLCLLMAAVFAGLAQWQIARSILPDSGSNYYTDTEYLALEEVSEPGKPFTFQEVRKDGKDVYLRYVLIRAKLLPSDAVLVNNRVQVDGSEGSWLVIPAISEFGRTFIAVGFIEDQNIALEVLDEVKLMPSSLSYQPLDGRYLPSEAPVEQTANDSFDSMSVAQLVNFVKWPDVTNAVYPGFIAMTKASKFTDLKAVDPIEIGLSKTDAGLNWLSLFYALEWIAFALFAVFMWWRLLADAYRKEQQALLDENQ
jgi:cytochrome oxidase assembly protein ShyY1